MAKYMSKKVKAGEEKVECKIFGMSRNLSLMNCTLTEEDATDYHLSVDYFIEKFTTGAIQTEHAKIYFNELTMDAKYPEQITMKLNALYHLYHKGIVVPDKYYLN